jgi:hypothetical protein
VPHFRTARVDEILSERPGFQRLRTSLGPAYVLTKLTGPVAQDDNVVLNVTAVDRELGSGGWHVVHWNLSHDEVLIPNEREGHIMKMRYSSLQSDTGSEEEYEAPLSDDLKGMPVVVCELHSQMPLVVTAAKHIKPELRIGYVMNDSAALPYVVSDIAYDLENKNLLDISISAGQAFGAQQEAVNVASGLSLLHAEGIDVAVVAPGVGVVGTGTELGFSSLVCASDLSIAGQLNATPIIALRFSEADPRDRHKGTSHHARTILEHSHPSTIVPIPKESRVDDLKDGVEIVDVPDVMQLLEENDLQVTSMGRSPQEDPRFFEFAAAAGVYAASHA